MCEPIWWWWIVFLTIFFSGLFGGIARFHWEKLDGGNNLSVLGFAFLGVAAAFMVPLFLNTISSTLVSDSRNDPMKLFVLIGFCIAAATAAKQFIGSLAKKALDMSKEAIDRAKIAEKTAGVAESDAKSADNRAIAMYQVLKLIDVDDVKGAMSEVDDVIEGDPENSEAWAWKAYCLKREGRYQEAVDAIKKAMALEGKEVYRWLYNLACYQCLAQASLSEVITSLERAKACATSRQLATLKVDLLTDEDFDTVKSESYWVLFIEGLTS